MLSRTVARAAILLVLASACASVPAPGELVIDVAPGALLNASGDPVGERSDESGPDVGVAALVTSPVKGVGQYGLRKSPDERAPVTIGFAGDTALTGPLSLLDPLAGVSDLLQEPDLMVVNFESALAPTTVGRIPVDKPFLFRSPPSSVDVLKDAGVDVVGLANNHALDFGFAALDFGLEAFAEAGIEVVGAATTADAAYDPLYLEVGEWSVALLAFSDVPCDWSWQGENLRPGVAWSCAPFLSRAAASVTEAVERADSVIVMVHGGTEGVLCPNERMQELNRLWSVLGADVVINAHPHVVQGVTSYGETLVVRSVGNFAFPPTTGLTGNSVVALLTLSEDGLFLTMEPVVAESGIMSRPSEFRRQSIVNQINQHSDGWQLDGDGRVTQVPEWAGVCSVLQP